MKNILIAAIVLLSVISGWLGGTLYHKKQSDGSGDIQVPAYIAQEFNLYNDGRIPLIDSLETYDGTAVSFKEISGGSDLFVYFDTSGCPPCKELAFRALSEYKTKKPDSRISLLLENVRNRDLLVMQKELNDSYMFFKIRKFPFKKVDKEDEMLSPVFFQIDSTGVFTNCFKVDLNHPEDLKEYIDRI